MRLLQKIHDALVGPDGPPPLPPLSPDHMAPTPVRTRMGTPADVAVILDKRAADSGQGEGWRSSLEALFCVLDIDDSPADRAALARDLNVELDGADADDAEAMLHAALMQRLAENDAVAPQDFYK